jgi:hypothetical protein
MHSGSKRGHVGTQNGAFGVHFGSVDVKPRTLVFPSQRQLQMTKVAIINSNVRRLLPANLPRSNKPPYLSGQLAGIVGLTAAAHEEIRLARQELKEWEDAYDHNCTGDPDRYQAKIRMAEKRLRAALSTT